MRAIRAVYLQPPTALDGLTVLGHRTQFGWAIQTGIETTTFPLDTRKHQSRFEYEQQLVEWKVSLRRHMPHMEMFDVRKRRRRCGGRDYSFWKSPVVIQADNTGVFVWVKRPKDYGRPYHIPIRYQFSASCLWYNELRLSTKLRMPSLNPLIPLPFVVLSRS